MGIVVGGFGAVELSAFNTHSDLPALRSILADGKAGLSRAADKDRVLWHYRLGAVALRAGDWDEARGQLDQALGYLNRVAVGAKSAEEARRMFGKEATKLFIGEPYERAMAYFYRGLVYWNDGELDNARACFRSMAIIDSDNLEEQYTSDWNCADLLDGVASLRLGSDGAEAIKRATGRMGREIPPTGRILLVAEFGPGPQKYATGSHRQQLRFYAPLRAPKEAVLKLGAQEVRLLPVDDLYFQATTRGGRVMDFILANKAQFKDRAQKVGDVAMAASAAASLSSDENVQAAGGIIAIVGLVSYLAAASSNPTADVRMWENLPRHVALAFIDLPAGSHQASVRLISEDGFEASKDVVFTVPEGATPVVFLSDRPF